MKKMLVLAAAGLALVACDKMSSVKLESNDSKAVYAIGHDMGSKLQALQLSDDEKKILENGLQDGLKGEKSKVEMKDAFPMITTLIQSRNEKTKESESKESTAFMEKMGKEAGIQKTESGLLYKIESEGTGDFPKATDQVKVHYHGTLRDGKVFDSSKDRGEPATFGLDRVIPCWTEGVQKLKKGGKATLYCPPALAYGDRGAPPDIKPGAALKFDVELIDILGPEASAAAPAPEAKKEDKKKK